MVASDGSATALGNLRTMFDRSRLGGTGYLVILPVDQRVEHSAGASFAPVSEYFDPEDISEMFEHAHELGMFTVLWVYLRNEHFEKNA